MKVIRDTEFIYDGQQVLNGHTYLVFKNRRYCDYIILVAEAKYVHTQSQRVEYLYAEAT